MKKESSVGQQKDVMATLKNRSKSKKRIILLIVAAIIVLLFFYVRHNVMKAAETIQVAMTQMQTDEVSKRSLIKSVGATGVVVSIQSKDIKADLTGVEIEDILVEIGDTVTEGQDLVLFNTSDIEENLQSAEEQLSIAKQKNNLSAKDAQRNVENAERTEKYQVDVAKTNMDNAYKTYKDTMDDYNNASDTLDDIRDAEEAAYNNYEAAKKNADSLAAVLATKKTAYEEVEAKLEGETVSDGDALRTEYITAKAEMENAQKQYDAAQANLQVIQNQYNSIVSNRKVQEQTVNSLALQVNSLEDNYNSTKKSYENTIASQASSVESAKSSQKSTSLNINTDSQEKQVEQYQEQLEKGSLKAPFQGIVTAVNFEEGDTYSQGAIVTIQDCSSFEVEAEIGEYDISDIELGQKVLIKTDATRDEELEGTVVFISPTATKSATAGTGVTYTIRIAIDTPNDRLRLDMTASLSIIIEQHDDVLAVPYNAVQTDEDGNTFIELIGEDGVTTTQLPVVVEMESSYYTEISADSLKEGQKIKVVDTEEGFDLEFMMRGGGF